VPAELHPVARARQVHQQRVRYADTVREDAVREQTAMPAAARPRLTGAPMPLLDAGCASGHGVGTSGRCYIPPTFTEKW
jgi:hypothetical protein